MCVAGPAAGGRTAKVVFKELIMALQCTSGAFKISQIKYLPPFHAPALFFHVVTPPFPSKGHNEGSVWMQLSITSSTREGILEFHGAGCSGSTHAVILGRARGDAADEKQKRGRCAEGERKKTKKNIHNNNAFLLISRPRRGAVSLPASNLATLPRPLSNVVLVKVAATFP